MRHAACRFRDDVCISRIRLGFTCVQIGDPAHCEPRKIGDCDTFSPCHRNWKSADRCRLIDDEQYVAMFFELGDERSKFGCVFRPCRPLIPADAGHRFRRMPAGAPGVGVTVMDVGSSRQPAPTVSRFFFRMETPFKASRWLL